MKTILLDYGELLCEKQWEGRWEEEFHHKVYYCLGGTAFWEQNGKPHRLKKGCLYLFPLISRCRLTQDAADPFRVLWFHIDTVPPIGEKILEVDMSPPYLERMVCALRSALPLGPQVTEPLLDSLFTFLEREGRLSTCRNPGVNRAIAYIRENLSESLSNDLLADLLGYNKNYFIRLFKEATGHAPHEYVRSLRMERARALIQNGYPLSEVAARCGVCDANTLSRDFRRYFGCSPTWFRHSLSILP